MFLLCPIPNLFPRNDLDENVIQVIANEEEEQYAENWNSLTLASPSTASHLLLCNDNVQKMDHKTLIVLHHSAFLPRCFIEVI